jgi:diacylglycerol kinase (ATP)
MNEPRDPMNVDNNFRPSMRLARLAPAWRQSIAGLRQAVRGEAAFRQELIGALVLVPLAMLLPVTTLERLILVLSILNVLAIELLNSAIEATVDRISIERHPLAGQAKDMGSAAVLVALAMSALCWIVISGPLVVAWLR